MSQREIDELINDIYLEVTNEYDNNPDEFVRKHIDYDILTQLLFGKYSLSGFYFSNIINSSAIKLFPYIDLSEINWYGILVEHIDFSNTNVNLSKLDFQTVDDKNVKFCNFEGMDLSKQNFNGVNVIGANFNGCKLPRNIKKARGYLSAIYDDTDVQTRLRRR